MSHHRQLAAIMFTDIEGYTALMQRDEKEAIAIRERHRTTFEATTEAFNGTIIQYFGDGTLSVFKSTVEAVDCAIELQKAFLENPKIPIRIGIHVGDIIHSKDDIIGDAVNVASRIESCAVPGSILISDKVHDQIRSHQHIQSKFMDAYEFKNVDGAMPLFAIANSGLVVPEREDIKGKLSVNSKKGNKTVTKKWAFMLVVMAVLMALTAFWAYQQMSDKAVEKSDLSIAVLPFDNLSTDEDSEIFRDGVTEDILTQLSKLSELHVISRMSVKQFKSSKQPIAEIAKKLGVAYILQGSIRKYGDKVRVTAQLVLAKTDEQIWTGTYDKTITDIFAIQSEVSKEIVVALDINITADEAQSLNLVSTQNVEAYKLFLEGRQEADKRNEESIIKSIELYKEAIALDSNYAEAYAEIANSIYLQTYYGNIDHVEAGKIAKGYLNKAEAIDDKISRIYSVRGLILNIEGKPDLAKKAFNRALFLSPNDLTARHQYATLHYYTREYDKQLEQAEIAYRLDPLSFASANSYFTALLTNKKFDEAEQLIQRIEADGIHNNQTVIHRSFFRLYMDKRDYNKCIVHLEELAKENKIFVRFLGYCYAKVGDTTGAKNMIDRIRKNSPEDYKSHELAVVYSGLQKTDSVLFHLDTIRNKRPELLARDHGTFFEYLKDNETFKSRLQDHGIY